MKKFLLVLLSLILVCVFIAYRNSNPKIIISSLARKGNIEGRELRYRVYFMGVFPLGEAVLEPERIEQYEGREVYHLAVNVSSSKIVAKFFDGAAALNSYIDIKELSPVLFKQRLTVSGSERINKEIAYDQKQGFMSIAGVRRQILPETHDPLSIIRNIRHMDFDKAKELNMNLNTNQKNYVLRGSVEPKELTVRGKIYKIALLKSTISRRDKNPYHKSNIDMVLLRGDENIPVLIKVFASGVLVNVKLVDIK